MAKTMKINEVNFTVLTGKKAQALVHEYKWAERNGARTLYNVYDRWSYRKEEAYEDCLRTMRKVGGLGYYISGYNTMQFCFVYMIRQENSDKIYIVKETKCNRYICEAYIQSLR